MKRYETRRPCIARERVMRAYTVIVEVFDKGGVEMIHSLPTKKYKQL